MYIYTYTYRYCIISIVLYASHVHFWRSSNRPIASTIESFEDISDLVF